MKFRDINGRTRIIGPDFRAEMSFCEGVACGECSLYDIDKPAGCTDFILKNPETAAACMGYEYLSEKDADAMRELPPVIYRRALARWGLEAQVRQTFEEMAELQKELCKRLRGKDNLEAIAEEIADVRIMLEQMVEFFGIGGEVSAMREEKLIRLAERLDTEPEPPSIEARVAALETEVFGSAPEPVLRAKGANT